MKLPRLVALDLDGTLLGYDCSLSPVHAQTIIELRQRGVLVAIVTGRPVLTTRPVWERLQLDTPLVAFNGVWVGWPEKPLMTRPLSQDAVRRIVSHLPGAEGTINVYPDEHRWVMHRFTAQTESFPTLYDTPIEVDPAIEHNFVGQSYKVMFIASPERIPAIAANLKKALGGDYHVVVSQEDRLEVHHKNITKAWGLEQLAKHLDISREEVWAVGDAMNDEEMLIWAGKGFAMGQAPDALKRHAQAILPPINEDGLKGLLEIISK
jgi:Cof subfamily protein (haloacid dehalogenase superfamily)